MHDEKEFHSAARLEAARLKAPEAVPSQRARAKPLTGLGNLLAVEGGMLQNILHMAAEKARPKRGES